MLAFPVRQCLLLIKARGRFILVPLLYSLGYQWIQLFSRILSSTWGAVSDLGSPNEYSSRWTVSMLTLLSYRSGHSSFTFISSKNVWASSFKSFGIPDSPLNTSVKLKHNLTTRRIHFPCSASNFMVAARISLTPLAVTIAIGTSPGSKEMSSLGFSTDLPHVRILDHF